jgi:DNA polymerase elongation subunit (family B)
MSCIVGCSYVRDDQSKPQIVLTLRDEQLKRIKVFVPFTPYFFVREEDYPTLTSYVSNALKKSIQKVEYGFIGIDGNKLVKLFMSDPSNIGDLNRETLGIPLYESNIPFHYRFLIDTNVITGIDTTDFRSGQTIGISKIKPVDVKPRHKVAFIDIEVLKNSKPLPSKDPVIVIGIYDCTNNEYHSIFIGKDFEINLENTLVTSPRVVIKHPCQDENELFATFGSVWSKIGPDIISSFTPFDMTYLIDRMGFLGIDSNFLSPIFRVTRGRDLKVHCLQIVDYAELYRKVFGEPVWNTLDFVANKELRDKNGNSYGKLSIADIVSTFKTDYTKIVEYNLRDVELLKDIEDEMALIKNYLLFVWSVTGLDLYDCLIPNRIGDILHFRHVKGKYIFYSESPMKKDKFEGGLVTGTPGLHYNIAVLDWNELYPTIMETFHVSMDTFGSFGDIVVEGKITESCNKVTYSTASPGWTNELMKPFRIRRQEIKRLAKETKDKVAKRHLKTLSAAIKVINNGLYGLYGQKTEHFTSRFYDPRIAGSIPFLGRQISEEAKKIVESIGYRLVYRDTDSLFIQLHGNDSNEIYTVRDAVQLGLAKYISDCYHIESKFRLDLEYIFAKVIVFTKKRYDGITTDGERVIKGLNIVRKDTAIITVVEQEKMGKMKMDGMTIGELRAYKDQKYNDVKHHRVPLEQIAVMGRCSKKKYPVINRNNKAIVYARSFGIEIEVEQRFYWLYIIPKDEIEMEYLDKKSGKWKTKKVQADIIGFTSFDQIPNEVVIDYKTMAEFDIESPLSRYVEEEAKPLKQHLLSNYW